MIDTIAYPAHYKNTLNDSFCFVPVKGPLVQSINSSGKHDAVNSVLN